MVTKAYESSASIAAPPERVWALLTDASAYTDWNPAVLKLEGRIAPGEKLKVTSSANPKRAFPVKVTTLEAPSRMVWSGGMPLGLFSGVRTYTLTAEGATTRFHMREEYSGPMAGLIGRSIPDLQPSFDQFAAAVKARAERPAA
jgi:hypothetical protein